MRKGAQWIIALAMLTACAETKQYASPQSPPSADPAAAQIGSPTALPGGAPATATVARLSGLSMQTPANVRVVETLFRPFGAQVCVEADESGKVWFTGPADLIGPYGNSLRQFCADYYRDEMGCGFDIDLSPIGKDATTVQFQLNPVGLQMGQHGFNLNNGGSGSNELWLGFPDQGVIAGRCLKEVWSDPPEKGKRHPKERSAHFVWTCGPTKYPLKEIPNQGRVCGQAPVIPGAQAASVQSVPSSSQSPPQLVSPPVTKPPEIPMEKLARQAPLPRDAPKGVISAAPAALTPISEGKSTPGLESIYFAFDKYTIDPEAQKILQNNAEYLKKNPASKVRIEGNCDERGTVGYNMALGENRAKAAQQYLVDLGIQADRISTVSYGKERPLDPNAHNEEAWAKDRRDDFVETSSKEVGKSSSLTPAVAPKEEKKISAAAQIATAPAEKIAAAEPAKKTCAAGKANKVCTSCHTDDDPTTGKPWGIAKK